MGVGLRFMFVESALSCEIFLGKLGYSEYGISTVLEDPLPSRGHPKGYFANFA